MGPAIRRVGRSRIRLRRLVEKSRGLIAILDGIAAAHGVSASQVSLNWLVNFNGATVVAIPGASKAQQARESAGAMGFALAPDEMAKIDQASRQFR